MPIPGLQSVEERKLEASSKAWRDSGRLPEGVQHPLKYLFWVCEIWVMVAVYQSKPKCMWLCLHVTAWGRLLVGFCPLFPPKGCYAHRKGQNQRWYCNNIRNKRRYDYLHLCEAFRVLFAWWHLARHNNAINSLTTHPNPFVGVQTLLVAPRSRSTAEPWAATAWDNPQNHHTGRVSDAFLVGFLPIRPWPWVEQLRPHSAQNMWFIYTDWLYLQEHHQVCCTWEILKYSGSGHGFIFTTQDYSPWLWCIPQTTVKKIYLKLKNKAKM